MQNAASGRRTLAVGGMLVGASFTLFRMRKQLLQGIKRAVSDLKKSADQYPVCSSVAPAA